MTFFFFCLTELFMRSLLQVWVSPQNIHRIVRNVRGFEDYWRRIFLYSVTEVMHVLWLQLSASPPSSLEVKVVPYSVERRFRSLSQTSAGDRSHKPCPAVGCYYFPPGPRISHAAECHRPLAGTKLYCLSSLNTDFKCRFWVMSVPALWLKLCTSYSSSCLHHLHHPYELHLQARLTGQLG